VNTLPDRPTTMVRGYEVRDGHRIQREIETVLEEPLSLVVNGTTVAVLMRLPGMEKELAAGFVVSEGLVADFRDVFTIHHCGRGAPGPSDDQSAESRNSVEVLVRPEALHLDDRDEAVRLIRAGCGAADVASTELALPAVEAGLAVGLEVLGGLGQVMQGGQRLRKEVGGVHAAAIFGPRGDLVCVAEDIGRHNAADKAIGYCLLRDIPFRDKILLSSGRLSYEMVSKAVRAGIPILASMSAPTSLAVALAENAGIGLVGYLRGARMRIYSHPERFLTA